MTHAFLILILLLVMFDVGYLNDLKALEVPRVLPWPTNISMYGLSASYDGDTFLLEVPTVLNETILLCTLSLPCMLNLVGRGNNSITVTGNGSISCLASTGCLGISLSSLNFACLNTSLPNPILRVQGTFLEVSNTTFAGCSSQKDGTAIQAYNGAKVSVTSCTFKDLHSNGSGGAINIVGGSAHILFSVFVNCQSVFGGGAIWYSLYECFQTSESEDNDLVVEYTKFESCESIGGGGAIFASADSNTLNETLSVSINMITFYDCHSDQDGGAFKLAGSTVSAKVSNSLFDSCIALLSGGAISSKNGASLVVGSTTLEKNSAFGIGGGAIYIFNSTVSLDMVITIGNSAPFGGGGSLFWQNSNIPSITNPLAFCGQENSALYGNCLASDFRTLRIQIWPRLETNFESPNMLFPGIPFMLSVTKLDFYNQTIITDSSSVVQIFQITSSNSFSGFSTTVLGDSLGNLLQGTTMLSIALKPIFSTISFQNSYTSLKVEPYIHADGFDSQSNQQIYMFSNVIHLNFENGTNVCPPGYVLRLENESKMQGTAGCTFCQPGTYSLNPLAPNPQQSLSRAPACLNCPSGGNCNTGGSVVTFTLGTWSISSGMYKLISCPAGFVLTNTSANGAFSHDNQQCGPCLAGYFLTVSDPINCTPCPAGFYCTGGTAPKAPCAPGRISPDGANESESCHSAPFLLVADQLLPMSLNAFTSAAAQNFRSALALAAGVSVDRVLLLAVMAASRRTAAEERILVRSQIACDNNTMVDAVSVALQSPSSTLNARLALFGLPGGSLQSLTITVEGQPAPMSATPASVIAGSIVGAAVFVGLVFAAGFQLLALRKRQAERTDLQATFELAKPGDRATGRHLPVELRGTYIAEKVLGNGPFRCVGQACADCYLII